MTHSRMSLTKKRVVVIGGATGIGAAIAALAKDQGATVVVGSRRPNEHGHSIDVRDEASVQAFFAATGPFDHLAITAGDWDFPRSGGLAELDLAQARSGFEVRFWGVLATVKHALATLAKNGSITLTSGVLVHRPAKGMPLATAIGGAVEHLTRALAVDLAPIRVNAVCPGLVLTDIVKQMPEAYRDATVAPLPLPRAATPEEAAQAYVYAMLNGYVTGQIMPVDGGALLI